MTFDTVVTVILVGLVCYVIGHDHGVRMALEYVKRGEA